MMGVRTPKTCWVVHKLQVINLRNYFMFGWFIWNIWWCTDLENLNLKKDYLKDFSVCVSGFQNRPKKLLYEGLIALSCSDVRLPWKLFLIFAVSENEYINETCFKENVVNSIRISFDAQCTSLKNMHSNKGIFDTRIMIFICLLTI
jgi:hypothetical protein